MIDIDNITFSYGSNVVLKNITMHLEEGRIYGLLGENGVGKTTLLTLLCGLKKVKSGHIEIDGHIPFNREPSFLSLEYFLSDEVAPMPAEAEKFASSYGRFWEKFDMSKFLELMQIFETDPKQKMNRMSFGQLADRLCGVFDRPTVGKTVQQIERTGREVQRTLSRGENSAPGSAALQPDAACQTAQTASDDDGIESHNVSSSVKCMSQTPA